MDAKHFDSWLSIAINLSHYWASFPDEILAEFRSAFTTGGWEAVRELCTAKRGESPWAKSFARFGGILPPKNMEHCHTTTTGRLSIEVAADGTILVLVYRLVGAEKIMVAGAQFDGTLKWISRMLDSDWERLGGNGHAVEERHLLAVNEVFGL